MKRSLVASTILLPLFSLGLGADPGKPTPKATGWYSIADLNEGISLSVPIFGGNEEISVRRQSGKDFYASRIQNYSPDPVSEDYDLKPGQFFLEIDRGHVASFKMPDFEKKCVGKAKKLTGVRRGFFCAFDPALLMGEASITHTGVVVGARFVYRFDLDGSGLQQNDVESIYDSIRGP